MKVSYDEKNKNILTWWNAAGEGEEDNTHADTGITVVIKELNDINNPSELEHPLSFYCFNAQDELELVRSRLPIIAYDHTVNFGYKKNDSISRIAAAAEEAIKSVIGIYYGQWMIYGMKEREASIFISNDYVGEEKEFPFLHEESKKCDIDIKILANNIIKESRRVKILCAKIESIRIKYSNIIKASKKATSSDDFLLEKTEKALIELKEV